MSQIPIGVSSYGQAPSQGQVRNSGGVRLAGITQSLGVPGIAVTPPVPSRNAAVMAQALQMIQGLGNAAGLAGQQFDRDRRFREREAEKVKSLYEGAAGLDARTQLPGLLQKIQNREILVPDGVPVEDYVRDLLAEQLDAQDGDGNRLIPEAYANSYRNLVQPQLAQAFIAQQQAIIDEAKSENLQLLREAGISATSPDSITEALEQSKVIDPTLTDTERYALIVLPSLKSAAESGDTARFNNAAAVLGDRFPGERLNAQTVLDAAIRQRQNRVAGDTLDAIIDGANRGESPEAQRARIDENAEALGPQLVARLRAQADQAEASAIRDSQQAFANSLRESIILGNTDPQAVAAEIFTAIQRPPSDPRHIDETAAKTMLGDLESKFKVDESMRRVQARLGGKNVALTADNDSAIMEILSSGQKPIIGPDGQISSPERAAAVLAKLDRIPSDIMQQIDAGARSDQAADVANAARLYWTLKRIAPAALDKANGLSDTGNMRMSTIVARLERDSRATLLHDGSDNPAFLTKLKQEAQRVLPLNAANSKGVEPTQKLLALTGAHNVADAHENARDLLREVMPEWSVNRTRGLFGFDILYPDKTIDTENLPPKFNADFRNKAADWYINLTHAGWTHEQARKESAQRALDELESDHIFVTSSDRLYVLPRYDNPADMRWTAAANDEWAEELSKLRDEGKLSPALAGKPRTIDAAIGLGLVATGLPGASMFLETDIDINEWRPITQKGRFGFLFAHVDDPMHILTDNAGNPVQFRPKTVAEVATEQDDANRRANREATAADRLREYDRKVRFMRWIDFNRVLREQGRPYDDRIDGFNGKIDGRHINWYRHAVGKRIDINKGGKPEAPPLLEVHPISFWELPPSIRNDPDAPRP